MVNFRDILAESIDMPGFSYNPYAGENENGSWIEGYVSIAFLNDNFGQFNTASEMKEATTSEGLRRYFDWLVEREKLSE